MDIRVLFEEYKRYVLFFVLTILVGGGVYWQYVPITGIDDYVAGEDRESLSEIFIKNWHWLFNQPFNNYMLDERLLFKRSGVYEDGGPYPLTIKVYREQGRIVGSVIYYIKAPEAPDVGFILFLVVDASARRKGYAQELLQYAFNQLQAMGARKVQLVTKETDIPAQKLYKKVGFVQTDHKEGFVYFERCL